MDKHHEHSNDRGETVGRAGEPAAGDRRRGGTDKGRRRLLQGAAATSAVYTLATRPVLAQGACTSSVLMSGNMSLHPDQAECRLGCSPGYWMSNSPQCWEAIEYNGGPIMPSTPFHSVFLTDFSVQDIDPNLQMGLQAVLGLNGNAFHGVQGGPSSGSALRQAAFHAVAAFLNTVHPEVNGELYPNNNGYPYTPEEIVNDFDTAYQEYLDTGSVALFHDLVSNYDDYNNRVCPISNHCG